MLSQQSNTILQHLYDDFRSRFVGLHPGCNENDVERAFLCAVAVFTDSNATKNYAADIAKRTL